MVLSAFSAIVFAVMTGVENIYTAPEFSLPWLQESDPAHLRHIYGQLTFGVGLGTLSGAGVGCLMLWLLRLLLPMREKEQG